MVKPLQMLASRALQTQERVLPHLIRLQHGFMTETSLDQTQQLINQMQEMLREMRVALHAPPKMTNDSKNDNDVVPVSQLK